MAPRKPPKPVRERARAAPASLRPVLGGRITSDLGFKVGFPFLQAPADNEELWRTATLDSQTLMKLPASRLMTIIPDLSPEVSESFWNTNRLFNPGWTVTVYEADPQSEAISKEGTRAVGAFLDLLDRRHGLDVIFAMLSGQLQVRGALFFELVLSPDATDAVGLGFPDPATARYELWPSGPAGAYWRLYQWVNGTRVYCDPDTAPTVFYRPVDPMPGGPPYGRAPIAPALFVSIFTLTILHDMRRVIAQAGYSHTDFEVVLESLLELMPPDLQGDPEKQKEWIDATIADLKSFYSGLQPDDALVHTDVVKINRAEGAVTRDTVGVAALLSTLERMAARATKSMPITLGISDGVSEANATRQWEIQVAGIKAMQHLLESAWGQMLGLVCRVAGVQARVEWRFSEARASEELRDAQTRKFVDDSAAMEELMGWTTHEESARRVTGHGPAKPEPVMTPQNFVPFGAQAGAAVAQKADASTDAGPKTDEPKPTTTPTAKVAELVDRIGPARLVELLEAWSLAYERAIGPSPTNGTH